MKKDGLMEDECNGDMDLGGVKMRYPFPDKKKNNKLWLRWLHTFLTFDTCSLSK